MIHDMIMFHFLVVSEFFIVDLGSNNFGLKDTKTPQQDSTPQNYPKPVKYKIFSYLTVSKRISMKNLNDSAGTLPLARMTLL